MLCHLSRILSPRRAEVCGRLPSRPTQECRLNRPSSAAQLQTRIESALAGSPCLSHNKLSPEPSFTVVHYAGPVQYLTAGLVEKNKVSAGRGLQVRVTWIMAPHVPRLSHPVPSLPGTLSVTPRAQHLQVTGSQGPLVPRLALVWAPPFPWTPSGL